MFKVSALILLLVLVCIETAHAACHYAQKPDKQQMVPFADKDSTIAKRDISTSESTVQNWLLVCEQLCGASLGGPPCGPQCRNDSKTNTTAKALGKKLIANNEQIVCSKLCDMSLGGSVCTCKTTKGNREQPNVNSICGLFCKYANIQLNGCSPCLIRMNRSVHPKNSPNSVTSTVSTTPNWDELCKTLCKNGEGGQLCNCDIPPFF